MGTPDSIDGFDTRDLHAFNGAFGLTTPANGVLSHPVHWGGEGQSIQHARFQPEDGMYELTLTISDDEALSSLYAHLQNGWSMLSPRRELYTLLNPGELADVLQHSRGMLNIPPVRSEGTELRFSETNS
ncbi:MAG: hypothetical protein ABL890_03495 [Candidatus Peribacteraceae bacterium]